jgi:hypothetical protein
MDNDDGDNPKQCDTCIFYDFCARRDVEDSGKDEEEFLLDDPFIYDAMPKKEIYWKEMSYHRFTQGIEQCQ